MSDIRTNRYASKCAACQATVPANGGRLTKEGGAWVVRHLTCVGAAAGEAPRVIETRFSSGAVVYRNSRGRCEDAPCCGCCSY